MVLLASSAREERRTLVACVGVLLYASLVEWNEGGAVLRAVDEG